MFLILISALLMCLPDGNVQTLSSPDGNLEMTFSLYEDGTPTYALRYKETEVVATSVLGYELRGRASAKSPQTYNHRQGNALCMNLVLQQIVTV